MPRSRHTATRAAAVGAATTLLVWAASAVGLLTWIEYKLLDLRFRYANAMTAHPDIVMIDIDDGSLDMVQRWPWPRDVQAAVLDVLAECGLRGLVIDLTLVDPEPIRSIAPAHADVAFDPIELASRGDSQPAVRMALPDHAIAAALRDLGRAYLAFDFSVGNSWRDALASDAISGAGGASAPAAGSAPPRWWRWPDVTWSPTLWSALTRVLAEEPTLDADEAAARLPDASSPQIVRVLEACREAALRRRIDAWLSAPGNAALPTVQQHAALLESLGPRGPRYVDALSAALRRSLAYQAIVSRPSVLATRTAAIAAPVLAVSPAHFMQARAARRGGFVAFEPDSDGVVRRLPLAAEHRGHALTQLALAAWLDLIDAAPEQVSARRGLITVDRSGAAPLRIPLDADSKVVVPWLPGVDWTQQFGAHLPVSAAWQVADRRDKVRANRATLLAALEAALERGAPAELAAFADDLRTQFALEDRLRLARYKNDAGETERLRGLLAENTKFLHEGEAALAAACGASPDAGCATMAAALNANAAFAQEIEVTLGRLRGALFGKIGVLGYTATALPDMAPIPTNTRAPGVLAHANLLNGLLNGRFVTPAPAALNALVTLAAGLLATLAAVRLSPQRAATTVAAGAVLLVLVAGGAAFRWWMWWFGLAAPLVAAGAAYVAVLLYRYVFLERDQRAMTTALSQYTSPTLARRMAEDPELCRRAESREVSAMFTDLAGFTTISERIGAERTQRVLNVCLGRLSDAIIRHEGMINKFIGDGIFAFWNPVIYPQPEHALQALRAALDLQAEMDAMARDRGGLDDEVFGQLVLRVGVATGAAVVGPCGSEQKYDYTCIGDSVNVAARLESANKFFGTRILVSGATLAGLGEFAVRALGSVQVKGKMFGVPVFELLGRAGQVQPEALAYAARFAAAVAVFQRREFAASLEAFGECFQERPEDRAAQRYIDASASLLMEPPGERWNGAIELTEK